MKYPAQQILDLPAWLCCEHLGILCLLLYYFLVPSCAQDIGGFRGRAVHNPVHKLLVAQQVFSLELGAGGIVGVASDVPVVELHLTGQVQNVVGNRLDFLVAVARHVAVGVVGVFHSFVRPVFEVHCAGVGQVVGPVSHFFHCSYLCLGLVAKI